MWVQSTNQTGDGRQGSERHHPQGVPQARVEGDVQERDRLHLPGGNSGSRLRDGDGSWAEADGRVVGSDLEDGGHQAGVAQRRQRLPRQSVHEHSLRDGGVGGGTRQGHQRRDQRCSGRGGVLRAHRHRHSDDEAPQQAGKLVRVLLQHGGGRESRSKRQAAGDGGAEPGTEADPKRGGGKRAGSEREDQGGWHHPMHHSHPECHDGALVAREPQGVEARRHPASIGLEQCGSVLGQKVPTLPGAPGPQGGGGGRKG